MTTPKYPLTSDVKETDLTKILSHDIINYKEIQETKK